MKKKTLYKVFITSGLALVISASMISVSVAKSKSFVKTNAATMPSTIDLKDNSASEIKDYYSSLNGKSSEELQGTNLLKNLKSIINHDVTYFSYAQVGDIYVITDRDWKNSPANEMSGYDSSSNTISGLSYSTEKNNNPYLHLLYCDYSVKEKTHYKGDGDVESDKVSFDKEHAWSQTHGFKGKKDGQTLENLTGAGTDLHHLKAGTQFGNRTLHSNYSYGFVKENDKTDWQSEYPYETKNKRGAPLVAHSGQDQQNKVFEPQDSDKGDIARALLYMVACYNNYDGSSPTPENPALKLVNYVISENTSGLSSDNLEFGYYGILQDLLAWHAMDPVDEFEIHRNNLIYNNYQHNRNPFIDYPEWVEYIWGASKYDGTTIDYKDTPTGSVDLSKDVINGYRDGRSGQNITPTDDSKKGFDLKKYWWVIVIAVVVVIAIIILVCVGVVKVKVTKRGKVKVKVPGTTSKKSSSKKSSSGKKKK